MDKGYMGLGLNEKLIYDLIFSESVYEEETLFEIKLFDYINDLSELNDFCAFVVDKIKMSNIDITEDVLIMTSTTNVWKLKLQIKTKNYTADDLQ
jgi:hypothetical protein